MGGGKFGHLREGRKEEEGENMKIKLFSHGVYNKTVHVTCQSMLVKVCLSLFLGLSFSVSHS